jgi:ATP-dependent exoDNAse (exonuclease V) alpha subunit
MSSLIVKSNTTPQSPNNENTAAASQEASRILGKEQHYVYEQMENSDDIMFITGKAGTGKSFLLRYFKENTRKKAAVVAPTGMAAINVGGQTIHSFFQLAPEVQIPQNMEPITSTKLLHLLRCVEVIIIDEVSMVRADLMDMIDQKLQLANNNRRPFGGKQIIMFGDPYQLPPVVDDKDINDYLMKTYKSPFFFSAPVFEKHPMLIYELSEVFRQRNDKDFVDILNKIRIGSANARDIALLNNTCKRKPDGERQYLTLVPTNGAANRINDDELRKIQSPEFAYKAEIAGEIEKSEYPTEVYLKLKVGALVVMLENKGAWVNGTLGTISYLNDNLIRVTIRGIEHTVDKKVWEKRKYCYDPKTKSLTHKIVATFEQYPVKLAWALTIHKAQGQTYNSVAIDMGSGAFENGQTYVALSRCAGMKTLYLLRPITLKDIKVNPSVAEFMRPISSKNLDDSDNAQIPQTQQITNISVDNDEAREILSLYMRLDDSEKRNFRNLLERWKSGK